MQKKGEINPENKTKQNKTIIIIRNKKRNLTSLLVTSVKANAKSLVYYVFLII